MHFETYRSWGGLSLFVLGVLLSLERLGVEGSGREIFATGGPTSNVYDLVSENRGGYLISGFL